jgi:hypothetical protein
MENQSILYTLCYDESLFLLPHAIRPVGLLRIALLQHACTVSVAKMLSENERCTILYTTPIAITITLGLSQAVHLLSLHATLWAPL